MIRSPSARREAAIVALLKTVRWLPRDLADSVCGLAGVAAAIVEPERIALAHAWGRANGRRARERWRVALAVLAHRGRILVDHWMPVFEEPAAIRRRVRIEGQHHLDAVNSQPRILLGFHFGVPAVRWALAAFGYECVAAGDPRWQFSGRASAKGGWDQSQIDQRSRFVRAVGSEQARAVALYTLASRVRAGDTARLVGDGDEGRELFRVSLPAGSLVVRGGWWLLRRQTAAVTLPVMAHRDGRSTIVSVSPPLSAPLPDAAEDLVRCQGELVPLLQAFAARHADQILPWRLDGVRT